MRLLDLFCGAGGAAAGYHQAGFTEIVGIDIEPQPNYPFHFIQADALELPVRLTDFDLIHASPPCQGYSVTRSVNPNKTYPMLIDPIRIMLQSAGRPWVIENVERAPLNDPLVLCGTHFGLNAYDPDMDRVMHMKRHRLFESSFFIWSPGHCWCSAHRGNIVGVYGGGGEDRARTLRSGRTQRGGYTPRVEVRRELMGMDWATRKELSEAIPPAYTKYIGEQFLASRKEPK